MIIDNMKYNNNKLKKKKCFLMNHLLIFNSFVFQQDAIKVFFNL